MNTLRKKYLLIAAVLLASLVPMAWIFRTMYQPQLVLREQGRLDAMDPETADHLLALGLEDRFDLTDTLELIQLLLRDGRTDDSLRVFQRLYERHPDVPGIAFWYATSLSENRRWSEAEKAYLDVAAWTEDRLRESDGMDFSRARDLDLVMAYRRAGLPVTLMSVDPQLLYRHMGENALAAGMVSTGTERAEWFARAEGYFQNALKINPDAMDVRGAYANLLLQMDRHGDSLAEYLWMLEREPENTGWLESAAVAAAAGRDFEAAALHIRAALRLEENPRWRINLARYLSWGGRHDAALHEVDSLISAHPQTPEYIRERHQFLLNAERHTEFLEATDRWAARFPEEFPLRLERVRVMIGLNRYEEAARECAAILALDPDQFEAALLEGEALLWMGQHVAAQEKFRRLEEQHPLPAVRKRLAQSYLWGQKPQQALPLFRKLDPASMYDPEIAQGYAEALALQEWVSSEDLNTVEAIHSRIRHQPDESWPPAMLAALSRVFTRADHPVEAVELLRSAVEYRPEDLSLKMELADLLHALGRFEEADELYQIILSLTQNKRSS